MERDRRAAVLLVVGADPLEQRVLLRLEPLLEEDDRLVAARDLRRAHEPVQLLDLLDRVARDAGPQRLLHDAVEVDEQLLPQPVVDLALARRVLAHQPPERGALVRRVVVDVQVGVDAAARLDPVDEALERGLLAVAVEAPDDLVAQSRRRRGSTSRRGTRARAPARRTGGPRGRARRRPRTAAGGARKPRSSSSGRSSTSRSPVRVKWSWSAAWLLRRSKVSGRMRATCGRGRLAERGQRRDAGAASRSACSRPSPATMIGWSSSIRWSRQRWRKSQIVQW